MPKVMISTEIEDSGHKLIQALSVAVKAAKAAQVSGAPMPAQIAADLVAAVSAFAPVAGAIAQVGADVKEDKVEFIKGCTIALFDLAEAALA